MQLQQFASGNTVAGGIADCHRPVVESLLDCGSDFVEVRGHIHSKNPEPDQRREILVLECQRTFVVVVRGTTAEQTKVVPKGETAELTNGRNATVFANVFRAFMELEEETFALLDNLTEESPFCDIVFTGHAFGGAMATVASYLYASTRTDQRVACLTTACARVGLCSFRWSVHSLSNLKVMRLEQGPAQNRPPARHVGHALRLAGGKIKALKFHEDEASNIRFYSKRESSRDYVQLLEGLTEWVKDYQDEDGAGVRGANDEARQVV